MAILLNLALSAGSANATIELMNLKPQAIVTFQTKILDWYQTNKRDLPWRHTRDPYKIFLSEVMSQQTQISRVIPKYEAWLTRFPTITDVALGSVSEVLRYWSGLGYNRRALSLQKAAQVIVHDYQGLFPQTREELEKLPGIGRYTASAVLCFAFDDQIPVIDTNIRKVITHEIFKGELPSEKIIEEVAEKILPKGKAYIWNQALMDYSAIALKTKRIPVAKQSHFLSSDRYYRGQTVKLLLEKKTLSLEELHTFFENFNPILPERLHHIIEKMQKDGLIILKNQNISLSEV